MSKQFANGEDEFYGGEDYNMFEQMDMAVNMDMNEESPDIIEGLRRREQSVWLAAVVKDARTLQYASLIA